MKDIIQKLQTLSLINDNIKVVEELSDFYRSVDGNIRIKLREDIYNLKLNLKLLSLSGSIVEVAINEKKAFLLHDALLIHSIEDFKWDPRENYIYLSMINYAYDFFKKNVDEELIIIRDISSENANSFFSEFFNRPRNLKSLKAMGLTVNKINRLVKFDVIKPPWLR